MGNGVSIIISTFNGKERLGSTLCAIAEQNLSNKFNVEVLLIDNASNDDTAAFVQNKWQELGNPFALKIITEPNPGKINAQNTGFANAQYSYVLICDDDNILDPEYIQNGYNLLISNPQIGALGGRGIPKTEVPLPAWFEDMAYMFACAPQGNKTGDVQPQRNVIYGAGMFVNMLAFNKVKQAGFKSLLPSRIGKSLVTGAEDGEICWWLRLGGYEIWYAENLFFQHYLPASRLTSTYQKKLLTMFKMGFPVGKLYLRIYRGELTKPIKYFWLKEIIYTLIYIPSIPFSNIKDKWLDLKRSVAQVAYFAQARQGYDNTLVELLEIKKRLDYGKI